jgi:hypothetical protein
MALFYGDSNIIPRAIEASSAKMLEQKIHKLQLVKGMEYKFINFYFDTLKQKHVGWYYVLITDQEIIEGALNAKVTE